MLPRQLLLASSSQGARFDHDIMLTDVSFLQGCKEVHTALASRTNQRQALDGHFSVEVVRYSRDCKGTHLPTVSHLNLRHAAQRFARTLSDHRLSGKHSAIAYEAQQPELLCCTVQQARARRRRR